MTKRVAAIAAALMIAASTLGASAAMAAEAPCAGSAVYATFYEHGGGTGDSVSLCQGSTGWSNLAIVASPGCEGQLFTDSGDWDDCFTSLKVSGLTGTKRVCFFDWSAYGGQWARVGNGQWAFTSTQGPSWVYVALGNPGFKSANDAISSFKWCSA